jgi:hypothetical protein
MPDRDALPEAPFVSGAERPKLLRSAGILVDTHHERRRVMQTLNLFLAAALLASGAAELAPTSQAVNAASSRPAPVAEEVLPETEVELEVGTAPEELVVPAEEEPVEAPPTLRQPDGTDWSDGVHVDPDLGIASDVTPGNFGLL